MVSVFTVVQSKVGLKAGTGDPELEVCVCAHARAQVCSVMWGVGYEGVWGHVGVWA